MQQLICGKHQKHKKEFGHSFGAEIFTRDDNLPNSIFSRDESTWMAFVPNSIFLRERPCWQPLRLCKAKKINLRLIVASGRKTAHDINTRTSNFIQIRDLTWLSHPKLGIQLSVLLYKRILTLTWTIFFKGGPFLASFPLFLSFLFQYTNGK